jgi:hypothetical protein
MKGIYVCEDNADRNVLATKRNPMKLNTYQIIALLVVVMIGVVGLFSVNTASKAEKTVPSELLVDIPQISPHYFDYSRVSLAKSKQNGSTVLFFAATSWCNTCSALDLELKERSSILPTTISVLKIDYDHDTTLKAAYGVTTQHTMILLDQGGKEIKRWIGGGIDELVSQIN